jgi:N-acetylmuramoyl-L-alanine amidase
VICVLFKVIAGSFRSRENADERGTFLHSKGIESFISPTVVSMETWYRVQAGAFSSKANAQDRLEELKEVGISDSFIIADSSTPVSEDSATILGPIILSAEDMNHYVTTVNPTAIQIGAYYENLGSYYGIRGDVAFAQALFETNFFRFTGSVQMDQNNFAGIGATGAEIRGASFETEEEGVLAHLQHLFAYATTNPLPPNYPLVDPRFHLVQRGSAPIWTELNGKWAVPGETYGQSILDIYIRMVNSTN